MKTSHLSVTRTIFELPKDMEKWPLKSSLPSVKNNQDQCIEKGEEEESHKDKVILGRSSAKHKKKLRNKSDSVTQEHADFKCGPVDRAEPLSHPDGKNCCFR
jgi:hypothetical protein